MKLTFTSSIKRSFSDQFVEYAKIHDLCHKNGLKTYPSIKVLKPAPHNDFQNKIGDLDFVEFAETKLLKTLERLFTKHLNSYYMM